MKAITPQECLSQAGNHISDMVIEVVNDMLKKEYRKGQAVVLKQDDIIEEIQKRDINLTREQIFGKGWLDFEPVFERAGWKVTYDKPGYNESYAATFEFSPKDK